MRAKIKLLLTRHPGVGDDRLDAALRVEAGRMHDIEVVCRAYAIGDADFHRVAAGAFDEAEQPFDALMDLTLSSGSPLALQPQLDGLGDRLGALVDPARCAILAGTEHVILPGSGPVLVTIANRRLPGFSHEAFLRYWLDYHGPFARAHTPADIGFRYRQFHADPGPTEALRQCSGFGIGDFDGAAECYYPDQDAVRRLMGMTQVVDQATIDEKQFVDHARCVTSVLRARAG